MNPHRRLSVFILAVVFGLAGCQSMNKVPPVSHDGLHLVPDTRLAQVYKAPDADFSQYKAVAVEPCNVSFRKHWLQDQNSSRMDITSRVTKKDMERIMKQLADACTTHFREAMANAGTFRYVDSAPESDVTTLVLRPSIVDLDITAPDALTAGRSRTYTTSAGEMTLYLEAYDGATNAIVARVIDRQKDPDDFRLQWTNSVTNKVAADRVLTRWTSILKSGLDQLLGTP